MRYTVVWRDEALRDLAKYWLADNYRQSISDAADRIDASLATDPDRKGLESEGRRILIVLPLAVAYEVTPDDRLVQVLEVVRIP